MSNTGNISDQRDELPVLVVLNAKGNCIHAGQPDTFKKKLLGKYAADGYEIKTMKFKEYIKLKWYDE